MLPDSSGHEFDADSSRARRAHSREAPSHRRPVLAWPLRGPGLGTPPLLALLAGAAVLYLWGLGASGWANAYYSGAAQAGSQSWKALFFGSFDSANGISVDKPPASLWVMALSVRIFGLSSWSILVPQALMGVAAVGLIYATVRRWSGAVAGLLAGAILAVTPVAVLMFRFNNPDALLVLLLMAAAYATVRALETASTRWLVLVGVFVGFAFLTKMLQAFLVVPAFALAYLIAAPTSLRRRIVQLLAGGLAMLVSAGWWVAIVEFVPARQRPYVGSSDSNSILDLIFGYNGLGRIFGGTDSGPGGGGPPDGGGLQGGGPFGFGTGSRLFGAQNGGQISWLLPAALILLVAALVRWRAPRTDRIRASLILWGGTEQVAVVERALGKVDHRGFDPAAIEEGERLLTGFAATFGPKELKMLADQVVDHIDPDETVPDDQVNADRRHFPSAANPGRGVDRGVPADRRAGLQTPRRLLGPLAKPRIDTAVMGSAVGGVDPRTKGQRLHDALAGCVFIGWCGPTRRCPMRAAPPPR